jgi:hypothetical protein
VGFPALSIRRLAAIPMLLYTAWAQDPSATSVELALKMAMKDQQAEINELRSLVTT